LLEALKQIAPAITRVAMMSNPINPSTGFYIRSFEAASKALAVQWHMFPVRDAGEIERAIETIAAESNSGLVVPPDVTTVVHRELVASLTTRHRMPAIYSNRAVAVSGGLMYYGADVVDQFKRAASYVARILHGEKPADLPVQQPTKFELVINLKTAKALGLEVPPTLLARADEVIE
jgi:putative ABC transport system substrate-binding protein